ncbi:MAG TPA: diacylglycerol kinase family protein [Stellaceae bacterium]|nr:diacylglycerol kinase family protein [Stellaceae bacterium]
MRQRILIIANPAAGSRRRGRHRLGRVVAALERRGCAVAVRTGPATGDAERLAREAEAEFDIVVAAGGDGTLNAVVNGLAATPRPFALLPFGTANVLARELRLPRRAEPLAELIVRGRAHPVWPGRVGERLFLTMASSGFDAEIVAAVDPRLKRALGRLAFVWALLLCLLRYRARALTVRADGAEYRAYGAIAAKGRFYAGPFVIAPGADVAEPALELVLLCRSGPIAMLRYLYALVRGRVAGRSDLLFVHTRAACIAADEALPVQADGEPIARLPVVVGIAERPLLLVGRSSPRVTRGC